MLQDLCNKLASDLARVRRSGVEDGVRLAQHLADNERALASAQQEIVRLRAALHHRDNESTHACIRTDTAEGARPQEVEPSVQDVELASAQPRQPFPPQQTVNSSGRSPEEPTKRRDVLASDVDVATRGTRRVRITLPSSLSVL